MDERNGGDGKEIKLPEGKTYEPPKAGTTPMPKAE